MLRALLVLEQRLHSQPKRELSPAQALAELPPELSLKQLRLDAWTARPQYHAA